MKKAIVRRNAGQHSLQIITDQGEQTYDLAVLNKDQRAAVTEMIVDWLFGTDAPKVAA